MERNKKHIHRIAEDYINQKVYEKALRLNQKTDHISLLTHKDENGPTKFQFLLRQGWLALIYRDLRLIDKIKFNELADITGYSSQMWRNLMKANYDLLDNIKKPNYVSDKFIRVVTSSLAKNGYFIDTEKMINSHKVTGAMVRMFWENGKCVNVLIQNSSEGQDIPQTTRIAINLREEKISKTRHDQIIIELDTEIQEPIKIELIVERNQDGELIIKNKRVSN